MAQSTLSLLGLYNYDNSILDDLALPADLEENRETITDNLLFETSEMEILYPDPVMLKAAIRVWSRKSLPVWQELYDTTQYEYNPIWNKDGTFSETETRNLAGKETRNLAGVETRNLTGGSQDSGTGSGTTEYDVFGYNSETAAHESKTTDSNTYSRTGSSTQTGTINNTDTGTIDNTDTGTVKRERTEQGNIGITSTQELIEKQRAVVEFNIMDRIIADFKQRFCLMVY